MDKIGFDNPDGKTFFDFSKFSKEVEEKNKNIKSTKFGTMGIFVLEVTKITDESKDGSDKKVPAVDLTLSIKDVSSLNEVDDLVKRVVQRYNVCKVGDIIYSEPLDIWKQVAFNFVDRLSKEKNA